MRRRRLHATSEAPVAPRLPAAAALEAAFHPRRVALIGATERPGSFGRAILQNLSAFEGSVFAVNPNRPTVLGRRSYPSISALEEKPDLAVIVTPAATVPGVIRECAAAGVGAALILSAGFRETGPAGARLEEEAFAAAKPTRMRIIGPNSFGLMLPHLRFNATPAATRARAGSVAFLSQSGALCASILDWSHRESLGFSGFVSLGSMLDVGWGDLIYHFGDDPQTRSIVLYMESVGDARSFLSAVREVALSKPVIVLKVGRTEGAARAAASHTGAITDSDEVLDAAFRRVGALRVRTLSELLEMAEVLGKQPRPAGPRLAIVSNAGGPGALAVDMLLEQGGELASPADATVAHLRKFLPSTAHRGNPVDVGGEAAPKIFADAVAAMCADPGVDGVLAILTPQPRTDVRGTAEALRDLSQSGTKPIIASWMGGQSVEDSRKLLNEAGLPTSDYPDAAASLFCGMWRHSYQLRALHETPAKLAELPGSGMDRAKADEVIQRVLADDRTLLTEVESKELLSAYAIPVSPTFVALGENEAVRIANRLGYPVVLKLHSHTLTHKSEVGGVQLNLRNPMAVREAWRSIESHVIESAHRDDFLGVTVQPMVVHNGCEVLLGSSLDLQFGPVLLFGTGGPLANAFQDHALGLPPLNATLVLRLIERSRIFSALRGCRGHKGVDLQALESLLVRVSYLVLDHPRIAEIDINPLIVASDAMIAVDARMVLHPPELDLATLPRPAIRPYPNQYVTERHLADGTPVVIRPILPEDEPRVVEFHKTLSDRSVYNRYFVPLKLSERIAHERLVRVCFSDYDREIPLVAEHRSDGGIRIIGIGRLSKDHLLNEGEFALVVSDEWQRRGLGRMLLELLIQVSSDEQLDRLVGHILVGNREMQHLCRQSGFRLQHHPGEGECRADLEFTSPNTGAGHSPIAPPFSS